MSKKINNKNKKNDSESDFDSEQIKSNENNPSDMLFDFVTQYNNKILEAEQMITNELKLELKNTKDLVKKNKIKEILNKKKKKNIELNKNKKIIVLNSVLLNKMDAIQILNDTDDEETITNKLNKLVEEESKKSIYKIIDLPGIKLII